MINLNKIKGFTLIELLVAISIIATLTAIIMPNLMGAREKARDTQHKQDLASIKNALRMYYNDKQSYPVSSNNGTTFDNYGLNSNATFKTFMPGIEGIGFTYAYKGTADAFYLKFATESVNQQQRDENGQSQVSCGIGTTNLIDYMICAF